MLPLPSKTILCADDDRELICEAITRLHPAYRVVHTQDGWEAFTWLQQAGITGSLPCLVILDINMPKMDGKQTLGKIRQTEGLSHVPVVMFCTAANPMDKLFFDRHGAKLFTKPSSLKAMDEQIEKLRMCCSGKL